MGLKQLIGFVCLILFSLLLCCSPSLAESNLTSIDTGLSINLLNQDPDPVKPGDILEISLSLENTGYKDAEDYVLEVKPEYPFRALPGEKLVEDIGTLGKRSEDDRRKVVKFKLGIENDVNEGTYPLKVQIYTTGDEDLAALTREINIDIDSESNAEIEYISVEKLVPGTKTNLIFGIKNVGNSPLKNAMFSWDCTNDVILPVGSSNVKHINLIDVGDTANVSFEVLTNVNTKPGLYKLDLVLTYDDIEELKTITEAGTVENQKRKQIKSKAGIYIGGTTDFDIAFMEKSSTGAYTFSVSNIGNNGANSVKVSVPVQANWTVTDGSNSVILGNLQKGDYTIADFNLEPKSTGEDLPIRFEITYTSSDGLRQVQEKILPLYALPSDSQAGSTSSEDNGGLISGSSKFLFLIIVSAAGFLFYKRRQKMKEKVDETGIGMDLMEEKKAGE